MLRVLGSSVQLRRNGTTIYNGLATLTRSGGSYSVEFGGAVYLVTATAAIIKKLPGRRCPAGVIPSGEAMTAI